MRNGLHNNIRFACVFSNSSIIIVFISSRYIYIGHSFISKTLPLLLVDLVCFLIDSDCPEAGPITPAVAAAKDMDGDDDDGDEEELCISLASDGVHQIVTTQLNIEGNRSKLLMTLIEHDV